MATVMNNVNATPEIKESGLGDKKEISTPESVKRPLAENKNPITSDEKGTPSNGEPSVQRGGKRLASLFTPLRNESKCQRCKQTVYQYEKMSPRKNVVFHTGCFSCAVCGNRLTLKNSCTNQSDNSDLEFYCKKHAPRMDAPKFGADAISIKRALNAPKTDNEHAWSGKQKPVNVNVNAMYIQGPLMAQKLQKKYAKFSQNARHHYPAYIERKRQEVLDAQKALEDQLKIEEDEMMRQFQEERSHETQNLTKELDLEWESRLKELTDKYEKLGVNKKGNRKFNKENASDLKTEDFENEKRELENTMTSKREQEKKTLTMKLIEKEQNMTSNLVKKQSEQMLQLLNEKREELKVVLEQEYQMELQLQQEFLEKHVLDGGEISPDTDESVDGSVDGEGEDEEAPVPQVDRLVELEEALENLITAPFQVPKPSPPSCNKRALYEDVSVFAEIDEEVIRVAENEQLSYTELVQQLTEHAHSDLEKARAIYRWITVKDLNVMQFDDTLDADTPMGLLRGIKFGTETYHTLFMRLCSYAGLHCEELKGHSKSVGYEPGMKFTEDTFQNTWNAVLINRDWRLVQCNWGARHLVLNKDKETENKDKIRYQYDDHYFLTDPDEFIQEFLPFEQEWQLLSDPITQEEFEELPFIRSIFFHYGMQFEGNERAIMGTDEKGGADITIRVPKALKSQLVFYYQLRFVDKGKRNDVTYKTASLERFVYQTMVENLVMFSIHVPVIGEYFFEVFANRIVDVSSIIPDSQSGATPYRLKCACKFKLICTELTGKMYPLPNCASGEWGPKKAYRHFGIVPLYDEKAIEPETKENLRAGIVYASSDFELKFIIPRPLQFVGKLRMNHVDDHVLDPYIRLSLYKEILAVHVTLPQPGQYGLDLYARPKEAKDSHTLSHACKYLINCNRVDAPVRIPKNVHIAPVMSKDKWGASSMFDKFHMRAVSHKDPIIRVANTSHINIDMEAPLNVQTSYQFIREPDEDDREYVSMIRDKKRIRFLVNLAKFGNYMLAIYARKDTSEDALVPNVFNYLIQYSSEPATNKVANGFTPASKFSSGKREYQFNKGDNSIARRLSPRID